MTVMEDLRTERKKAEEFKCRIKEAMEPCLTRKQVLSVLDDLIETGKSEMDDELVDQSKECLVKPNKISLVDM